MNYNYKLKATFSSPSCFWSLVFMVLITAIQSKLIYFQDDDDDDDVDDDNDYKFKTHPPSLNKLVK